RKLCLVGNQEEIYMGSEYTKESDIHYFKEVKCPNGEVYICLKKNKQIKKLIQPGLDEEQGWEVHDTDDEKKAITVTRPKTDLPITIVILRKRNTQPAENENVRCFGCTDVERSMNDILTKYRYRSAYRKRVKGLGLQLFY
ncbi:MAG: hypothetical protein ACI9FJ_003020, partial [Alteromonadaceae bacterium]